MKLALEDDMLDPELLRKVQVMTTACCCAPDGVLLLQLNSPADRCQSVSPFPDRKQGSLYARTVDLPHSQQVTNPKAISAHSAAGDRRRRSDQLTDYSVSVEKQTWSVENGDYS